MPSASVMRHIVVRGRSLTNLVMRPIVRVQVDEGRLRQLHARSAGCGLLHGGEQEVIGGKHKDECV